MESKWKPGCPHKTINKKELLLSDLVNMVIRLVVFSSEILLL